jgi:hypothetical protein
MASSKDSFLTSYITKPIGKLPFVNTTPDYVSTGAIALLAILGLLWFSVLLGWMYILIGNSDDFPAYLEQAKGLIFGGCVMGSILFAIGVTCVFALTTVDIQFISSILIATLAIGLSVAAFAIANITRQ